MKQSGKRKTQPCRRQPWRLSVRVGHRALKGRVKRHRGGRKSPGNDVNCDRVQKEGRRVVRENQVRHAEKCGDRTCRGQMHFSCCEWVRDPKKKKREKEKERIQRTKRMKELREGARKKKGTRGGAGKKGLN